MGYLLVASSGRALNACAYSLIHLAKLEDKYLQEKRLHLGIFTMLEPKFEV